MSEVSETQSPANDPNNFFRDVLRDWKERVRDNQVSHETAATRLAQMNYWLGIPASIISAVVGTSVFASLNQEVGIGPKIAVGVISIAVGVLTALQTFLRYAERSEKHHASAATLGAIHRQIELWLRLPVPELDEAKRILFEIEEKISAVQAAAPVISDGPGFLQLLVRAVVPRQTSLFVGRPRR